MFSDTFLLKEQGWVPKNWLIQSQLSTMFIKICQYTVSPSFPENSASAPTHVCSSCSPWFWSLLSRHPYPLSSMPSAVTVRCSRSTAR